MWDRYCNFRIFLIVQKIRIWGWWHGKPSLWQYPWREIACGLVAAQIRKDRNNGIEPSAKMLKRLRDLEKDYKVKSFRV